MTVYPEDDQRHRATAAVADVPDNQIRVENKLYSTQKLASLHPGGPLFIKVQTCSKCSNLEKTLFQTKFLLFRLSRAVMLRRHSYPTTGAISHTIVQGLHWRGSMTQ